MSPSVLTQLPFVAGGIAYLGQSLWVPTVLPSQASQGIRSETL